MAELLAQAGADVAIVGRDREGLVETAARKDSARIARMGTDQNPGNLGHLGNLRITFHPPWRTRRMGGLPMNE